MAQQNFLLLSLLLALYCISSDGARNFPSDNALAGRRNYTHVCHPEGFTRLGLNMREFSYCDQSLPYDVRVKDLIDRMTLEEKVRQIGDDAKGVRRIGLPSYEWWSEILHGVSHVGNWQSRATYFDKEVPGATSFPTPVLTAASFNETLWKRIGQAASTEARAMRNMGHSGLTFWSPNINVARDPRWGRILETPGEDPYVVGTYASNFVRGLQDVEGTENTTDLNMRPLKVAACCKHYAAYDVDNWKGVVRESFDARVREQDMEETFLRPFEMCVRDGDVSSVMCSYNQVNGIPTCANPQLLKETIRGKWDLHGYIVSDCDSVEVMVTRQNWLNDEPSDAVSQALKAGLDLDCGYAYSDHGEAAVVDGKVKESDIDNALKNLYTVLMRLGYFDGNPKFDHLGKKDICSKENIELAAEAAREGIVLLKHDGGALPLSSDKVKTIAVVGPHANATKVMLGNYEGDPCKYTSPLEGFSSFAKVQYAMGCADVACRNDTLIFPAMKAAQQADATVIIAGLDGSIEAESRDRDNLLLPGFQTQMINQIGMVSKGPVILVIMSAGGVDVSFAQKNGNIKAILWAGYPGEEGGRAIADVVFGKYNPSGRLPITWFPNDYVNKLPLTSMPLRPIDSLGYPGRTYKFYNGPVVYPFGFGLRYTEYNYKYVSPQRSIDIELNKFQHCRDLNYTDGLYKPECPAVLIDDLECDKIKNLEFEIEVENTGHMDGSDIVMIYWVPPTGIVEAPIKQLVSFQKVFVPAGSSKTVKFSLDVCKSFDTVDYKAYHLLASGSHSIIAGHSAPFPVQVNFRRSGNLLN